MVSKNNDNQKEAKRILDRVERESETIATSTMARSSDQFGKLINADNPDNPENDPIEVLGKRIGRGMGWIAVIFLVIYLFNTYVMK
jgi:tetrahydromethanopterin S-methyltransferase subunit G